MHQVINKILEKQKAVQQQEILSQETTTWISCENYLHSHINGDPKCDFEVIVGGGWVEEKGRERIKELKSSYNSKAQIKFK